MIRGLKDALPEDMLRPKGKEELEVRLVHRPGGCLSSMRGGGAGQGRRDISVIRWDVVKLLLARLGHLRLALGGGAGETVGEDEENS